MIKISQTGEPKLVKVPEKPKNCDEKKINCLKVGDKCRGKCGLHDHDIVKYNGELAIALAEEDKHFKFDEGNLETVRKALPLSMFVEELNESLRYPYKIGAYCEKPTGWRVEFEESEIYSADGSESEILKLAFLLPEQPEEKKEPVKNDNWIDLKTSSPEYYKPVLVNTNNGTCVVAWRANDGQKDIYTIDKTDVIIKGVCAWQCLPERFNHS